MSSGRVLLTGASSLPGSHILDQLLSYSVSVLAIVETNEEAVALEQQHRHRTNPPTLDFAIEHPGYFTAHSALENSLRDNPEAFSTLVHVITTDPSEEADCLARYINLQTEILVSLLKSVKDFASTIQRVVIITSLTPFARWLAEPHLERHHASGDQVPMSPGGATSVAEVDNDYILASSQAGDNIVYDALSRWKQENRAHFDLVYITAPSIYGPSLRSLETSSELVDGNRRIWNICSNDFHEWMSMPPYGIDHFTDARDLALATVRAVFTAHAGNKRFVISNGAMPPNSDIADFLVRRFPELSNRLRTGLSPPSRPRLGEPALEFLDTRIAETILGLVRYHTAEETLTDLVRQICELQKRKEWKHVIEN